MSTMTSVWIVCSTVCSGADQRKHQSSTSLASVRGIHWWPVNSPNKGPVTRKMFSFDDAIMTHIYQCINLCSVKSKIVPCLSKISINKRLYSSQMHVFLLCNHIENPVKHFGGHKIFQKDLFCGYSGGKTWNPISRLQGHGRTSSLKQIDGCGKMKNNPFCKSLLW